MIGVGYADSLGWGGRSTLKKLGAGLCENAGAVIEMLDLGGRVVRGSARGDVSRSPNSFVVLEAADDGDFTSALVEINGWIALERRVFAKRLRDEDLLAQVELLCCHPWIVCKETGYGVTIRVVDHRK